MDKVVRLTKGIVFGIAVLSSSVSANPLVGKMYDYEAIGESYSKQLNQVLAFEARLEAIKSNKIAFLSVEQMGKVNAALTRVRHIKHIHSNISKDRYYVMGREIVDSSLGNSNCTPRKVSLATTQTIQLNCKGLGYEIDGDNLFSEYEYSDFFLTIKKSDGKVVISSYVDGRLTHLEEQIMVIDDEVSRVYAPVLQMNQRTFTTPKS
ncbi:hypothetical protein MD588_20775 [Photobacterium sp. SDRW27]|uniref:hypothetical protein n=1 Tax=Photobacterium obscurum TaxID=2829490 RepID=UPI002244225B|nr:hypothetical protein [Photobacterium obscurum]MCW8331231.1 hypothetical protein [Photobacterium obscurum]